MTADNMHVLSNNMQVLSNNMQASGVTWWSHVWILWLIHVMKLYSRRS